MEKKKEKKEKKGKRMKQKKEKKTVERPKSFPFECSPWKFRSPTDALQNRPSKVDRWANPPSPVAEALSARKLAKFNANDTSSGAVNDAPLPPSERRLHSTPDP